MRWRASTATTAASFSTGIWCGLPRDCGGISRSTTERTVFLSFPHREVYDTPGYVQRWEANRGVECLGPADFGYQPDNLPAMTGILGENETFVRVLQTGKAASSTLADTIQTQEVREWEGESDISAGARYQNRLESLIKGWRRDWQCGEFPFICVQLASLNEKT